MPLIQLTYISTLSQIDSTALGSIVEASVRNNRSHHITGMLLYMSGSIMQTIEGELADVDSLYNKIGADPRHSGLVELVKEVVPSRAFTGWSVGFRDLASAVVATLPTNASIFRHSKHEVLARARCGHALDLLCSFGDDGRAL